MNTLKKIGTFIKDNLITLSVIVVVLSIAYHYVIYIPKRDSDRIEFEARTKALELVMRESAEKERVSNIEQCQLTAYKTYSESWDGQCNLMGRAKDCGLPQTISARLGETLQDNKANCIKIY